MASPNGQQEAQIPVAETKGALPQPEADTKQEEAKAPADGKPKRKGRTWTEEQRQANKEHLARIRLLPRKPRATKEDKMAAVIAKAAVALADAQKSASSAGAEAAVAAPKKSRKRKQSPAADPAPAAKSQANEKVCFLSIDTWQARRAVKDLRYGALDGMASELLVYLQNNLEENLESFFHERIQPVFHETSKAMREVMKSLVHESAGADSGEESS